MTTHNAITNLLRHMGILLIASLFFSCGGEKSKTDMTVISFNIRYDNPTDSLNSWAHRKDSVAQFLNAQAPDVVGMQEVLHNQMSDLQKLLPLYAAVGVGRDNGKEAGEYAPIFYRKDRFELLEKGFFWLSEHPDSAGSMGWDAACTRITTWVKLRRIADNREFIAVDTHLDHVGAEAQTKGAELLLSRIGKIAGDMPVFIMGDFNIPEYRPAYGIMTSKEYGFYDTYKKAPKTDGVDYTFHDFGRVPMSLREKIDYVFANSPIETKEVYIPKEVNGTVNHLSDHNPVIVTMSF